MMDNIRFHYTEKDGEVIFKTFSYQPDRIVRIIFKKGKMASYHISLYHF